MGSIILIGVVGVATCLGEMAPCDQRGLGSAKCPVSPFLSAAAAASGEMSRCGLASISYPTMNFRMDAERNSGG